MVSLIILTAYMCRKSKRKSLNSGLQNKAPSEGSASTGSTKSATMELYTSSYNETMSGGGETLSSISEKSCISAANHNGQNGTFPTQAYLMVREKILYIYIFIIISFLENTSKCNFLFPRLEL